MPPSVCLRFADAREQLPPAAGFDGRSAAPSSGLAALGLEALLVERSAVFKPCCPCVSLTLTIRQCFTPTRLGVVASVAGRNATNLEQA